MSDTPQIKLDHINLRAKKPEWLAEWYAEQFGFSAQKGFVSGAGTILVFEEGDPLEYHGQVHFGFRCRSRAKVEEWALKFSAHLDAEADHYCGFKTSDPEGNVFEVYWER